MSRTRKTNRDHAKKSQRPMVEDDKLSESISAKALETAKEFESENKAIKIVEIYEKMLGEKGVSASA